MLWPKQAASSSGRSKPSGNGGGVHKNFFWPFGPRFGRKSRGGALPRAPPLDPSLSSTRDVWKTFLSRGCGSFRPWYFANRLQNLSLRTFYCLAVCSIPRLTIVTKSTSVYAVGLQLWKAQFQKLHFSKQLKKTDRYYILYAVEMRLDAKWRRFVQKYVWVKL